MDTFCLGCSPEETGDILVALGLGLLGEGEVFSIRLGLAGIGFHCIFHSSHAHISGKGLTSRYSLTFSAVNSNPFWTEAVRLLREKDQMKRMKDVSERDRPREKIRTRGAASLSTQELIAAVLGSGGPGRDVRDMSRELALLIEERPDALRYEDLCRIRGMGPAKVSQIMACVELARRFYKKDKSVVKISSPSDILPLVSSLAGKKQEHFVCITLSGAHEVISVRTITVGLLNHSLVHPREVFAEAITDRAAAVICVHNHPSGTLEPSSQDIAITRQLAEAGTVLGISLLDHLIVTESGFVSMKERGLI
jgi:DNA repair protein RadC